LHAASRSSPSNCRISETASWKRAASRVSGPFTKGRVIDLSLAAAKELRMTGRGLMKVTAALQ